MKMFVTSPQNMIKIFPIHCRDVPRAIILRVTDTKNEQVETVVNLNESYKDPWSPSCPGPLPMQDLRRGPTLYNHLLIWSTPRRGPAQCCQPVQIICICPDIWAFSVLDNRHCADICTSCQKCQFEVRKGWQVLLLQSKAWGHVL